jgi:hypothetical protein
MDMLWWQRLLRGVRRYQQYLQRLDKAEAAHAPGWKGVMPQAEES